MDEFTHLLRTTRDLHGVKKTKISEFFCWEFFVWFSGVIHTAEFLKNLNISAHSNPNFKIFVPVKSGAQRGLNYEKLREKISWHTPFK